MKFLIIAAASLFTATVAAPTPQLVQANHVAEARAVPHQPAEDRRQLLGGLAGSSGPVEPRQKRDISNCVAVAGKAKRDIGNCVAVADKVKRDIGNCVAVADKAKREIGDCVAIDGKR